jgi:hypothetical protein
MTHAAACGKDNEYQTEIAMDSLQYTYTPSPNRSAPRIRFAAAHRSPKYPSSWSFSGKFKFGDLEQQAMTIDDGTYDDVCHVDLGVLQRTPPRQHPVENVDYGGTSSAPCAIDA